jgi:hypothetical protein
MLVFRIKRGLPLKKQQSFSYDLSIVSLNEESSKLH